jgi:hypothetical protein
MTIPSYVVVSMRQSAAEMYTKFLHMVTSETSSRMRRLVEQVLCW